MNGDAHLTNGKPAPAQGDRRSLLERLRRDMDRASRIVLVVDDEPLIRSLVRRTLQRVDPRVEVLEAEHGKAALAMIAELRATKRGDPLLIILDLKMPGMDGWELIDTLKEQYEAAGQQQGIPLIVLSSTSGEKGLLFKHSVHKGRAGYVPLVTVAKDACTRPTQYDASGEAGLLGWVAHFLKSE